MDAVIRFTFQKASFRVRNKELKFSEKRPINWLLSVATMNGAAAMEIKKIWDWWNDEMIHSV